MTDSLPSIACSRRPVVLVASALLAAASLLVAAAPTAVVGAQTSSQLVLREVDTVEPPASNVRFIWTGSSGEATDATLTENGSAVDTDAARPLPGSTPMSIALVFDTSDAMDTSGALLEAKEAAKDWVRGRDGAQQGAQAFAVYAASDAGVQIQSYTTDTQRLVDAIDSIAPPATEEARSEAAVWSALAQAAQSLDDRPGSQPNIVVMTATNDTVTGCDDAGGRPRLGPLLRCCRLRRRAHRCRSRRRVPRRVGRLERRARLQHRPGW